jgi:hypothetical protein
LYPSLSGSVLQPMVSPNFEICFAFKLITSSKNEQVRKF